MEVAKCYRDSNLGYSSRNCTVYCPLHFKLYYTLHFTLHCTLYCTLHFKVYCTLHFKLYCTLNFVLHCTLYFTLQCTPLWTLYCKLHFTAHCTAHCTLNRLECLCMHHLLALMYLLNIVFIIAEDLQGVPTKNYVLPSDCLKNWIFFGTPCSFLHKPNWLFMSLCQLKRDTWNSI